MRFADVRKGMEIVVGHQGVRVVPAQRATSGTDVFQLLNTNISAERPKGVLIREIARELEEARKSGGKILIVTGASVVSHWRGRISGGDDQRWLRRSHHLRKCPRAVYDIEALSSGQRWG